MNIINQAFEVVVNFTLAGNAVLGLTDGDFSQGDFELRYINPDGASPAAVQPTPGQDLLIEEIFDGTYALKFGPNIVDTAGRWALQISNAGVIDDSTGVVEVVESSQVTTPEAELGWLSGKNTVDIVVAYDSDGNPTQVIRYGFLTAADALAFSNNPSGNGSLVQWVRQSDYTFEISTGRLLRYSQRVL